MARAQLDDVIKSSMMVVMTCAEITAETMESRQVTCCTTRLARMWAAQKYSKVKTNCHSISPLLGPVKS